MERNGGDQRNDPGRGRIECCGELLRQGCCLDAMPPLAGSKTALASDRRRSGLAPTRVGPILAAWPRILRRPGSFARAEPSLSGRRG